MKTAVEILNKIKTLVEHYRKNTISGRIEFLTPIDVRKLEHYLMNVEGKDQYLNLECLGWLLRIIAGCKTKFLSGKLFDELERYLAISSTQKEIWKTIVGYDFCTNKTLALMYTYQEVTDAVFIKFTKNESLSMSEESNIISDFHKFIDFIDHCDTYLSQEIGSDDFYWLLKNEFDPVDVYELNHIDLHAVNNLIKMRHSLKYIRTLAQIDMQARDFKSLQVYQELDTLFAPSLQDKRVIDDLISLCKADDLWITISILNQAQLLTYDNFYKIFYESKVNSGISNRMRVGMILWIAKEVKLLYLDGNVGLIPNKVIQIFEDTLKIMGPEIRDRYKFYRMDIGLNGFLFRPEMYQREDYLQLLGVILEIVINFGPDDYVLEAAVRCCAKQKSSTADFLNVLSLICIREYRLAPFIKCFDRIENDRGLLEACEVHEEQVYTSLINYVADLKKQGKVTYGEEYKETFYFFFKSANKVDDVLDRFDYLKTTPIFLDNLFKPGLFSLKTDIPGNEKYLERDCDINFEFK